MRLCAFALHSFLYVSGACRGASGVHSVANFCIHCKVLYQIDQANCKYLYPPESQVHSQVSGSQSLRVLVSIANHWNTLSTPVANYCIQCILGFTFISNSDIQCVANRRIRLVTRIAKFYVHCNLGFTFISNSCVLQIIVSG